MSRLTLVLGGARSGKSRHAEALGDSHRGPKAYIATAQAFDDEMRDRIGTHRQARGPGWITYEAPLDLVRTLTDCRESFVLIDCVTLWISNLMQAGRAVDQDIETLCEALRHTEARVVIVSNEVGQGIVPDNALARAFRDLHGIANQRLAEGADEVVFVVAGLPMVLKTRSRRPASPGTAGSSRGRKA